VHASGCSGRPCQIAMTPGRARAIRSNISSPLPLPLPSPSAVSPHPQLSEASLSGLSQAYSLLEHIHSRQATPTGPSTGNARRHGPLTLNGNSNARVRDAELMQRRSVALFHARHQRHYKASFTDLSLAICAPQPRPPRYTLLGTLCITSESG
jgi:hypothetical protein